MLLVIFVMVTMLVLMSGVRIIKQHENGVYLLLGKFHSVLRPGWNMVVPLMSEIRMVDLRVWPLNVPRFQVFTRDGCPTTVDARVYVQVEDAKKAILLVDNYQMAAVNMAQNLLKEIIAQNSAEHLRTQQAAICDQVAKELRVKLDKWGLTVPELQLLNVYRDPRWQPPPRTEAEPRASPADPTLPPPAEGLSDQDPRTLTMARLEHLVEMMKDGYLSEAEFQQAKAKILGD